MYYKVDQHSSSVYIAVYAKLAILVFSVHYAVVITEIKLKQTETKQTQNNVLFQFRFSVFTCETKQK